MIRCTWIENPTATWNIQSRWYDWAGLINWVTWFNFDDMLQIGWLAVIGFIWYAWDELIWNFTWKRIAKVSWYESIFLLAFSLRWNDTVVWKDFIVSEMNYWVAMSIFTRCFVTLTCDATVSCFDEGLDMLLSVDLKNGVCHDVIFLFEMISIHLLEMFFTIW